MTALITPPNWRTVAARSERLPQSSVMLRCTLHQHKTEDSRAISMTAYRLADSEAEIVAGVRPALQFTCPATQPAR